MENLDVGQTKCEQEKTLYWVSLFVDNHFNEINVKSENVKPKDMTEFLWFENESDANKFVDKLKKFIKIEYKICNGNNKDVQTWY